MKSKFQKNISIFEQYRTTPYKALSWLEKPHESSDTIYVNLIQMHVSDHISLPEISGKYQADGHVVTKVNHAVSDQFGGYEEVLGIVYKHFYGLFLYLRV